jgi:hypothetical protein
MINEKEIRIGNWFHHTQQWSTMQGHDTLDYFDFKWTSSNWYQIGECLLSLEVLEPITLDEDWLLKCSEKISGMTPNPWNVDFAFRIKGVLIIPHKGSYMFHWESGNTKIEYVHQLQNLYFALIGEELVLQD